MDCFTPTHKEIIFSNIFIQQHGKGIKAQKEMKISKLIENADE